MAWSTARPPPKASLLGTWDCSRPRAALDMPTADSGAGATAGLGGSVPVSAFHSAKAFGATGNMKGTSWPNMAQPIEIHQATLALLASIALHFCVSLIYSDTRSFLVVASMDWVGSL